MKFLVKTPVVPRKYYDYIIFQGYSKNLREFFVTTFVLKLRDDLSGCTDTYVVTNALRRFARREACFCVCVSVDRCTSIQNLGLRILRGRP